jgi:hypothetical protein
MCGSWIFFKLERRDMFIQKSNARKIAIAPKGMDALQFSSIPAPKHPEGIAVFALHGRLFLCWNGRICSCGETKRGKLQQV